MPNRYGFLLNFFWRYWIWGRQENMFTKETKSMPNRYGFLLIFFFFEILDMAHGEDKKTYPLRKPNYAK
jgi:hypothetical protein